MRFFHSVIIILMLSTCLSEPDCLVTASNKLRISLKNAETGASQKVLFSAVKISGTDVVLFTPDSVTSLIIPVDPLGTETTFIFEYGTVLNSVHVTKTDFVTVSYASQTVILSPTCGAAVYHTNLAVSNTSFTIKPKVLINQLSTSAAANIEIKL